ncbi:MAG TPA: MOSC N-terminal beta barrel domain-containing protein [Solirubrobacteraceae bacterium]|nr:MOSC N-terminal beta barrel domain-containing protein [Solirubrobacteraceae bacterium]
MPATVTALSITPVKSTQLRRVQEIRLDEAGVRENRRFFLIDDQGAMVNATHVGALNTVVSTYSDADRRLTLRFPDGRTLEDDVRLGEHVLTRFYGQPMPARAVLGRWSQAISDHVGKPLRLVEAGATGAVDRGAEGAITLISRASLERLAERAEQPSVDARRFRMLVEIDGVAAHEEDGWVGHVLKVGETVLRARGHVGRCVITSRHPETGDIDLHTLKILGGYRRNLDTTEPIAFGIYGEILRPGTIRLGDPVSGGVGVAEPDNVDPG